MADRFEDRDEVAGKINSEGGVYEALEYGVKAGMMPEGDAELAEAWTALDAAFAAFKPAADRVAALLPD